MSNVLIPVHGGSGGAFTVACNRSASAARFAARPSSRNGNLVRFGARRGSASESVWIPGNDPPIKNTTKPRFR